jgi:hypothetical protein
MVTFAKLLLIFVGDAFCALNHFAKYRAFCIPIWPPLTIREEKPQIVFKHNTHPIKTANK